MKKEKKTSYLPFIILFLAVAGVAAAYFMISKSSEPGKYDTFAQCLVSNGTKMYGAWWCLHCNDQKKDFGDSWKLMMQGGGYVECSTDDRQQLQVCTQAGINSYPTWRFPDGTDQTGRLDMFTIAKKSGCTLPA